MRDHQQYSRMRGIGRAIERLLGWPGGGAILAAIGGGMFGALFGAAQGLAQGDLVRFYVVAGFCALCGAAAGSLLQAFAWVFDRRDAYAWADSLDEEPRTRPARERTNSRQRLQKLAIVHVARPRVSWRSLRRGAAPGSRA